MVDQTILKDVSKWGLGPFLALKIILCDSWLQSWHAQWNLSKKPLTKQHPVSICSCPFRLTHLFISVYISVSVACFFTAGMWLYCMCAAIIYICAFPPLGSNKDILLSSSVLSVWQQQQCGGGWLQCQWPCRVQAGTAVRERTHGVDQGHGEGQTEGGPLGYISGFPWLFHGEIGGHVLGWRPEALPLSQPGKGRPQPNGLQGWELLVGHQRSNIWFCVLSKTFSYFNNVLFFFLHMAVFKPMSIRIEFKI